MSQRLINRMPMETLWSTDGEIAASRGRDLDAEDIKNLLRGGTIQFVVANIGSAPEWVPIPNTFEYWKSEVKEHLANSDSFLLSDFSDEYAYSASLWQAEEHVPIVLLEKHH